MTKKMILILGATSSIARATAMAFARQGFPLYLAGRDQSELARIASDLNIRYDIAVNYGYFDAERTELHGEFFDKVRQSTQGLAGVVQAFGYISTTLPGKSIEEDLKVISINFSGAVSILNLCSDYFSENKAGFIIGISSVAGDRGRQSNYIYCSAKSGLTTYLQGLRNKLHKSNVRVITIKPGYVDTPMAFGKPNLFLVESPEVIGEKIANTIHKNKDVFYFPWFWRYIMLVIKLIPENIFKRMNI